MNFVGYGYKEVMFFLGLVLAKMVNSQDLHLPMWSPGMSVKIVSAIPICYS